MSLYPEEGSSRTAAVLRWSAAGFLIAAAHFGAGCWVLTHPITQPVSPDTVQGITIDLEPISVPQNAPEPNTTTSSGEMTPAQTAAAPDPIPTEPASSEPPEPPEPTVTPPPEAAPPELPPPAPPLEPPPPVVASPPPEAIQSEQPTPVQPPPITLPQQEMKSDAVIAPSPKPRPVQAKPDLRALAREAAHRKAIAERRKQHIAARAEARIQARAERAREAGGHAPQDAAPSSASSGASIATWRGAVLAHLNAFKPTPTGGATGTARVAFSVDRNGRVLSASLAGGSGDPALDAAAVAMVRRASPVPAPPPEMGGRIALAVPVYFH